MTRRRQTENRPRRRWIVIGPGIVIATLLALQVGIREHTTSSGPPFIERHVVGASSETGDKLSAQVEYVLARAKQLKLSKQQVDSLENLQAEWKVKSKPLTTKLDRAAADFRVFMSKSKSGYKPSLQEIQAQAGPVSQLSRDVSSLRRIYWEKALQVLDDEQQKMIKQSLARNTRAATSPGIWSTSR